MPQTQPFHTLMLFNTFCAVTTASDFRRNTSCNSWLLLLLLSSSFFFFLSGLFCGSAEACRATAKAPHVKGGRGGCSEEYIFSMLWKKGGGARLVGPFERMWPYFMVFEQMNSIACACVYVAGYRPRGVRLLGSRRQLLPPPPWLLTGGPLGGGGEGGWEGGCREG